jgi:hypothetical protein
MIARFLLALGTGAVLVACGGSDGGSAETATDGGSDNATAPAETPPGAEPEGLPASDVPMGADGPNTPSSAEPVPAAEPDAKVVEPSPGSTTATPSSSAPEPSVPDPKDAGVEPTTASLANDAGPVSQADAGGPEPIAAQMCDGGLCAKPCEAGLVVYPALDSTTCVRVCQAPSAPIVSSSALADLAAQQCGVIDGSLQIGNQDVAANIDVSDLSGLLSLRMVTGDVMIEQTQVTNLDGLDALEVIGGRLRIGQNLMLENIDGLASLRSVQQLDLTANTVLNSVAGLARLRTVPGSVTLDFNGLSSLAGLDGLLEVGDLSIADPVLADVVVDDLAQAGKIAITSATIESVSFPALVNAAQLTVSRNDQLKRLDCPSLEAVSGLSIEFDDQLSELDFPVLQAVSGPVLRIGSNPQLEELVLPALAQAEGVALNSNGLVSISFPELRDAEYVEASRNAALQEVSFPKLQNVTTELGVALVADTSLEQFDLPALASTLELAITDNSSLVSIGPFAALQSLTTLVVRDNPLLPECAYTALTQLAGECKGCTGNNAGATCN